MEGYCDDEDGDFCDPETREFMVQRFRDPGGRSALHPGERKFPCPNCGRENALTAADVQAGYQCDPCADAAEGHGGYGS